MIFYIIFTLPLKDNTRCFGKSSQAFHRDSKEFNITESVSLEIILFIFMARIKSVTLLLHMSDLQELLAMVLKRV